MAGLISMTALRTARLGVLVVVLLALCAQPALSNGSSRETLRAVIAELEQAEVPVTSPRYELVLIEASTGGYDAIVSSLLKRGVSANAKLDEEEEQHPVTPLIAATCRPETMKILLDAGANPNVYMGDKADPSTPLIECLRSESFGGESVDGTRMLLAAGANPNIRTRPTANEYDFEGYTPLHVARSHQNQEVIDLLHEHGAVLDTCRTWGFVRGPAPKGVKIRVKPKPRSRVLTRIQAGQRVTVWAARGRWLEVKIDADEPDRKPVLGWVDASLIGPPTESLPDNYLFMTGHPVSRPSLEAEEVPLGEKARFAGCHSVWAHLRDSNDNHGWLNAAISR